MSVTIRAACCLCARQGPSSAAIWSGQHQLQLRPRRWPQYSMARGVVVCSADAEILGAYALMTGICTNRSSVPPPPPC